MSLLKPVPRAGRHSQGVSEGQYEGGAEDRPPRRIQLKFLGKRKERAAQGVALQPLEHFPQFVGHKETNQDQHYD
jgi:hypothetical protein